MSGELAGRAIFGKVFDSADKGSIHLKLNLSDSSWTCQVDILPAPGLGKVEVSCRNNSGDEQKGPSGSPWLGNCFLLPPGVMLISESNTVAFALGMLILKETDLLVFLSGLDSATPRHCTQQQQH